MASNAAFNVHPFLIDYIQLKLNLSDHVRLFAGKYGDRRL